MMMLPLLLLNVVTNSEVSPTLLAMEAKAMGDRHHHLGEYFRALSYYESAVAQDDDLLEARLESVRVNMAINDYAAALEESRESLRVIYDIEPTRTSHVAWNALIAQAEDHEAFDPFLTIELIELQLRASFLRHGERNETPMDNPAVEVNAVGAPWRLDRENVLSGIRALTAAAHRWSNDAEYASFRSALRQQFARLSLLSVVLDTALASDDDQVAVSGGNLQVSVQRLLQSSLKQDEAITSTTTTADIVDRSAFLVSILRRYQRQSDDLESAIGEGYRRDLASVFRAQLIRSTVAEISSILEDHDLAELTRLVRDQLRTLPFDEVSTLLSLIQPRFGEGGQRNAALHEASVLLQVARERNPKVLNEYASLLDREAQHRQMDWFAYFNLD